METQQELPNSTLILIFGILSIVGCCCWGVPSLIFGIIAVIMAKRAIETYNTNPSLYTGYNNVNTGRILAIIGIVLGVIVLIVNIVWLIIYGVAGLEEVQREMMEQYGG